MKQKIIFRADGAPEIGMGHFIRTLALAEMLKDDFSCIYATQKPTKYQIHEIENICTELYSLPNNETHFNAFLNFLQGDEIVVLDNYYFTTEYQRSIKRKGCKLVCIDDIHDKEFVSDLLINYSPHVKQFNYRSSSTILCLGLKYSLLRTPFYEPDLLNKSNNNEYKKLLIAFGGEDRNNLTYKTLKAIKSVSYIQEIQVLIGNFYKFEEKLNELISEMNSHVTITKNMNASEIKQSMLYNDFAILPASTIALEAISCGLPVLVGYYTDNQVNFYKGLSEKKVIYGMGDFNACDSYMLKNSMYTFKESRFSPAYNELRNIRSAPENIKNAFNNLIRSK